MTIVQTLIHKLLASRQPGYYKQLESWTSPLWHRRGVLYAVTPKIVKSNNNVLSYTYTCVKSMTVWLAVSYITTGTRLQFHSVESHFDVCDDSLVYRSRCNLDRSTRNACLVAIATVYNRWQSLLTRLSADRLKLTQPIRLITAVLRSSRYCVLTFLWWNETISSYLILSHDTVTNITQNEWMDSAEILHADVT